MKKTTVTLLLIILLVLSGCSQPNMSATPTHLYTTQPTVVTLRLTSTYTIVPTNTPEPTPTLTNTPTVTPEPTLTHQEAREKLFELLADNGGCQFPCLMGITPGKSSSLEANEVFNQFNSLSDRVSSTSDTGSWDIYYSFTITQEVYIGIGYHAIQDSIDLIGIEAHPPRFPDEEFDYENSEYGALMNYYMLSNILTEYGIPTNVYLSPLIGGGTDDYENGLFNLMLLYPEKGTAVYYSTRLQIEGDRLLGCMNYAPLEFHFYPSGDYDSFYENLTHKWKDRMEWMLPLKDVPGMTIEGFYETFRNPTDQCIETPLDFWNGDNP